MHNKCHGKITNEQYMIITYLDFHIYIYVGPRYRPYIIYLVRQTCTSILTYIHTYKYKYKQLKTNKKKYIVYK